MPSPMADRPPIIQYWHDPQPPEVVSEALASFEQHNPGRPHLIFDRDRAETFIGDHFSPLEVEAFRTCALPAMQADYFRYCAVFVLGGVYVDADFRCAADISQLANADGCEGLLFGRPDPVSEPVAAALGPYRVGPYRALNNEVFAFNRPGHPLLKLALEVATANIQYRVADGPRGIWLTTGPGIFTSMYLLHELGSTDAFLEYCRGRVLEATAPLFYEIVGDSARLARMLDDVRIRPRGDLENWLERVDLSSALANTGGHWTKLRGSIFQS